MARRRDDATSPELTSVAPTPPRWATPRLGVPLVIALGGALGALARYGIAVVLPREPQGFPWATFVTNAAGCLVIGVVMVLLTEVAPAPHRLLRPFVAVGVLGGFTTYSTYAVEVNVLLANGATGPALLYLVATPVLALVAVEAAMVGTRQVVRARQAGREADDEAG